MPMDGSVMLGRAHAPGAHRSAVADRDSASATQRSQPRSKRGALVRPGRRWKAVGMTLGSTFRVKIVPFLVRSLSVP